MDTTPFATYNQGPLTQVYGLPTLGSPRLLANGKTQVGTTVDIANQHLVQQNGTEELVLDGESHRFNLSVRHRTADVEWGIDLPYLSYGAGFLDDYIDAWHDAFGLPQGNRETAPSNQFLYSYRRDGEEVLRLTDKTEGVGDIRLRIGWPLTTGAGTADTALRLGLKLPTGEADRLLGSGAADLAAWVTAGCSPTACTGDWLWNAGGGMLWLGRGDVLPALQRRYVGFAELGVGYRLWPSATLKAELQAHTPFYRRTDIDALGSSSALLVLGGTWKVTRDTTLDLSVTEDIWVASAPDFGFTLNLRSAL